MILKTSPPTPINSGINRKVELVITSGARLRKVLEDVGEVNGSLPQTPFTNTYSNCDSIEPHPPERNMINSSCSLVVPNFPFYKLGTGTATSTRHDSENQILIPSSNPEAATPVGLEQALEIVGQIPFANKRSSQLALNKRKIRPLSLRSRIRIAQKLLEARA